MWSGLQVNVLENRTEVGGDFVGTEGVIFNGPADGIGDVPVPVRYFEEASSIPFRRCVTYGCGTLGVLSEFYAHRVGLINSPRFQNATLGDD